ncbi:MAG: hypothetical protein HYY29_03630 [Chloroflexi bacterium]|nr:hypothetical protein [Chloroflexota bacterium]
MPTIGELVQALPPDRRQQCSLCAHCHVEGMNEWNDPLTHCHLGNWGNQQGRDIRTLSGALHTRVVCEQFEDSGE